MKTNLTNFFNYAAKEPQNTGGGNSHSLKVVTPVWKGSRPTVSRRSTDSQLKEHHTHTLLCKALKYAAVLLMVFMVGIGQMWGADQTFTVEGPATLKHYVQDNIMITGAVNSKKIAGGSNVAVFYLQYGNYAPLCVISKSANIKKIEVYGNRDTSGSSKTTAFNVQTSSDAINFSIPDDGFTAKATNGEEESAVESLSGVPMVGNNQSYATTITITFSTPVMAIKLISTASNALRRVVITYDDAIITTPQICELHMTSNSAATYTGSIGTWTKSNISSKYTFKDTNTTPNNVYYNTSSGTYGYIDLGEGNAFAEGDEIWVDISGGSTNRAPTHNGVTTILTSSSSETKQVSIQPTCTIAANMPTYVHYITKSTDPWVGGRYLYIMRGNSDHSIYQVSVHRGDGGGSTPTTYTVTYDGNGNTSGNVPTDSNSPYEEGNEVTVLGNTGSLARTGYTFSGWNTEADGTGDSYAASETFDMGTANVTLYAKWTLNLSTHSAGTYETAAGSGGYGLTLKTYSGRDYEIYTFNTSKLYAGSSVTSSDGKEMLTAAANTDVISSDNWLLVRPNAVNNGGDYNSPDEFAFSSETDNDRKTHYISITNTDYIKLKVSGYDQFTFFGRDNGTSDGKKFVVKIDGVAQTFDHNSNDNTLYPFTLTTETHLIEVTADGTNACRFRGFSLRLPEVSCDATVPGDISAGDLTDGEITLTAEGSAESGDIWYWQSSASGTDDSDEYDAENGKTVDEAGTYYLRSYNTAGTCWSTAKSITLTAEDFVAHYAITYNKGTYGTGSIDAGDKTEDVDFTLSSDMFTRDGYVQVGWATTDGGTKAYDLGGSYTANAAITLYPVWAETSTYVAEFSYSAGIPTRWEFSNAGSYANNVATVDYVGAFANAATPETTPKGKKNDTDGNAATTDDDIAFSKNNGGYAIYDLGQTTTVTRLTAALVFGSSSAQTGTIEYLGADKSTVKKTISVSHPSGHNWGVDNVNETSVVADVRYIKVKGNNSVWIVMQAFSVTYGDVTPKYTVTYALNGGSGTTPTETDKKAGAVFTLHNGTTSITAPENKEFDGWLCSANSTKYAGGAEYTMTAANTTFTAQWKAIATKYAVTYVLNGPTGDAPTETNKAEDDEFNLAAAPTWADHVFEGWQWTDDESATHLEDAEAEFTMPAYAVTFTAQWRLDPQVTMSNAQYVIGGSALNMAAKFSSLNTSGAVLFSLKEDSEYASITSAGSFTATAAGEYIVVAEQAGDGTYANGSAEATVEVLESELSDTYVWRKDAGYTGCVANPNADAPTALYTDITYEGFTGMGRAAEDNTECILTFSIKNTYTSLFGIKDICTYGKLEEPLGGQISWDGGTNWEDLAAYSEGKKVFEAPGTFPTSFKIKFFGVSKSSGGLWWRNALVTLERKKEVVSTVIDLTDVKINGTSISSDDLATLKTADAYALDLADEYVTAPTVKFNKHTVITYEDDSEVEKDDVITETADVNGSGKWEASAEIGAITYTVTMVKADAFVVHYYQADDETLIGSENVAVNGHPTAAGITPTPQDYKRVVWTLSGEPVDLEDVTSDVAGTEITLVASYVDAYANSINIEQWVLNNKVASKAGFIAELEGKGYKQVDLNALDSLNDDPSKANRNYAFLGMKVNKATSAISFLLKNGSTVKARFGNMGSSVNVTIGEAGPVALTSGDYANTSVSSAKEYSYTAEADVIVKFQSTGTNTVVFKQIMIDEAIATVKLPAIVTLDANGGTYADESVKYTGTPLVIGDATPADEDYEFEGWHVGSVEGAKINAAAYEPTANVTLVAKYVAKPSPFSLSALTFTIGAGEAQEVGYVEGTYEYDVELPYAGSYETITVAYTLAEGTSSEKEGAVLSVTSVPGAAAFTVVAANETEKTYTVNFKKEAKDGLSIIKATISGGNQTAGFDAEGLYAGKGYANTASKKLNTNNYVGVQLKAGQSFQAGDKLFVVTSADADRGFIELYQEAAGTTLVKALGVRDASAGIALPSEAYGLNEIYIVRKASEGDQSWNGTVNYVEVTRPMNPVLKSITFDGTKINVASTTVEEILPYSADLTAVTPEIFWNGAGTAVVTTNEGDWAWGDNTYVLTDKDGDATTYTITLIRATRSSDKSLSSLTVDGNAIALEEGVYNYTYVYPYGTNPATVPAVAAVANDAHASVGTITQAATASGTASFTVTAEDETTQDYTVRCTISRDQTLVIYDGKTSDPMSSIANPGSLTPGLEWTITGGSTSAGSASALTFEGKSYTKYVNIFGSATNENRYMSITIPENYMAKFYLVGCSNNSSNNSLFISKEITSTVDESIAFVTSTNTALAGMTSDYQPEGTYYLCCNNSIRIYELSVTLYPIDYTRTTTPGRLGTICLEKGGVMRGAAVYEVAYFNPDNQKIYFDEVIGGVMEPGMPYVFLPDEGNNNQLVVMYGNNAEAAEAGHHNGLYGSFTEELLTPNTVNYILSSNKYWYVNSENVYVGENRAYLKVAEITGYNNEPEPEPAPGRRRITMGAGSQAPSTATGMDEVNSEELRVKKMLINGQIFIIRGGKMFDATGRLVK